MNTELTINLLDVPKEDIDAIECRFVHQIQLDKDHYNAVSLQLKDKIRRIKESGLGESHPDYKDANYQANFVKHIINSGHMLHNANFVKEIIHLKDGTTVPNVKLIIDYQRPFWVTRREQRNHEQKRTWEKLSNVEKHTCHDAYLVRKIPQALGNPGMRGGLKQLSNQFVYGVDASSSVLINSQYKKKWPDTFSEAKLAVLDIETNVIDGLALEEPIYIGLTFKDKACISVTDQYASRFGMSADEFIEKMKTVCHEELSAADFGHGPMNIIKDRNLTIEYHYAQDPIESMRFIFKRANEWMPDYISIWNINFDLPRMQETCEYYGVNIGDIVAHPMVPDIFRTWRYNEAPANRITAKGTNMSYDWYQRWHTVDCLTPWMFIDQAAVYYDQRKANGKEPSMALDAIARKVAKIGKLKSDNTGLDKLAWHVHMQTKEPFKYAAYNLFDCIACEIIDEQPHVGDVRAALPVQSGITASANLMKLPRKACDNMHVFLLENGYVMASTGTSVKTEFDDLTFPCVNFIVTLPTHSIENNGLRICEDYPELKSTARVSVSDLDLKSAYPYGEYVLNASRETTVREIVSIGQHDTETIKLQAYNLCGGVVNAVEICQVLMNAPSFEQLSRELEMEMMHMI